jgi:hypothetical protein
MNNSFDDLMYEAGLTVQGCWDQMDEYDRKAIIKFAELIVQKCVSEAALLGMSNYENDDITWAALTIVKNIKSRFGVDDENK